MPLPDVSYDSVPHQSSFLNNPQENQQSVLQQQSILQQNAVQQNQYHTLQPQINYNNFPVVSGPSAISQIFQQRVSELTRSMNREVRKLPRVGRRELDLYKLYEAVQKRGGYASVTQWKDLALELDLPSSVTNAGYTLRTKYESFIMPFEQVLLKEFPVQSRKQNWIQTSDEHHNAVLKQQMIQQMIKQQTMSKMLGSDYNNQSFNQQNYSGLNQFQQQQLQQQIQQQIQQQLQNKNYQNQNYQNFQGYQSFQNPNQSFQQNQNQSFQYFNQNQQTLTHQTVLKTFSLKKLKLDAMNPTDQTFQKTLLQYPLLEYLTIGSLKNITQVPAKFPPNLKAVKLIEVPQCLQQKFIEALSELEHMEDLEVTAYEGDSQKMCSSID
uniref:ARID1 AT-rich interaction domain protein n=1 Tax=Trepomonas sp. PC1 TaxID=1076344 RepID=A0A146K973_9EUKA|eukprot:JAP93353.1 ARID1 AT-rich interaction domain protein [Trepomonas sp. PC1]